MPSVLDSWTFKPALVKSVFSDVTSMHVSRSAAWAAAAVTGTVLTEIIVGARTAAAVEGRKKLVPQDLIAAIDQNVELEVGAKWYDFSPTFRGLTGVLRDADGVVVTTRRRRGVRRPSAVAGAHRFEAGVKRLLRGQGVTAVPAMVRDLDGIASVFLTDLARDAAMVVREGGIQRFGTVSVRAPGDAAPPSSLPPSSLPAASLPASSRGVSSSRRTIRSDDVLDATTMQLMGGDLRQRALTAARAVAQNPSAG
ncbi:hypothetical protein ACFXDP_00440 [Streptomyces sp. NPDC059374]|uniref:hypothetical protein n=1 Tax=Streptomyces sp. NPDC059374 TaxID=3346814 RepID=UPI003680E7EE